MPYLLDTNVVIRHLNGDPDAQALVSKLTPDGIAVSTLTLMDAISPRHDNGVRHV